MGEQTQVGGEDDLCFLTWEYRGGTNKLIALGMEQWEVLYMHM